MKYKEMIATLLVAKAEVEWNYPLDYTIAIDKAVSILTNKEKYKWHDIRKDPKDLPEYGKRVEVAMWDKNTHEIDQHTYFTRYGVANPFNWQKMIDVWQDPYQYAFCDNEIIAWRESDGFTEEENED